MTHLGLAKDPWGTTQAGFEAATTLNRKDYGLAWNAVLETGGFLVGDEVQIALSIQAVAETVASATAQRADEDDSSWRRRGSFASARGSNSSDPS